MGRSSIVGVYKSTRTVFEDIANQEGHRLIHVYDQEDQISARKAGQPGMVVQSWMSRELDPCYPLPEDAGAR